MYKLIATDCDGTILNSKGYLPKEIIDTFKVLHNKGIHILLATGRNDILAKDYLDELDIDCPVAGCNGATLLNFYTNKHYFTKSMDKNSLDKIFDMCKDGNIGVKMFTIQSCGINRMDLCQYFLVYTCYTNDRTLYEGGINLITTKYTRKMKYSINYELVKNMHDVSGFDNVVKAVVIEQDIPKLLKIRDSINANIPSVKAVQSNWNCIDINSKSVSKGNAILEYAKIIGVKPDEIIAFGDSENDISMLTTAGLGIAVGNADDCVKASANKVIDTNDNFGVAKFLREIYNIND